MGIAQTRTILGSVCAAPHHATGMGRLCEPSAPPSSRRFRCLWYDSSGTAAGGRYLIADLNNVNLTRADILMI